jgi:hypothetical protein
VTVADFKVEIGAALKNYDRYVVCIEKTPDEFLATLESLVAKAISAFEGRGPNLRHGISLDRHVTVILSQTEHELPLCGIYFNLHSPYQKPTSAKSSSRKTARVSGHDAGQQG